MITIDNYLQSYDKLKQYSKTAEFKDIQNPFDGVIYPLICADIPEEVKTEIFTELSLFLGRPIKNQTLFMRMSPKNKKQPHKFHNDISMGKFSFMLYMQTVDGAGTGLARHETGMIRPENQQQEQIAIRDTNANEKWEVYKVVEMVENRAAIFDASLFHVALPIGGFGESQEDARIVLTCFFS
jgi:hypothetical protein